MVSASSAAATQLTASPISMTEPTASTTPKAERLGRLDRARPAIGRPARARHHRVDVAVVPHVDRARGAGADRDAQHRDRGQHRMQIGPAPTASPAKPVNTTSDMTRGFSSAT